MTNKETKNNDLYKIEVVFKYKKNDDVYFMSDNKVVKTRVIGRHYSYRERSDIDERVYYICSYGAVERMEYELFPTREALLASL